MLWRFLTFSCSSGYECLWIYPSNKFVECLRCVNECFSSKLRVSSHYFFKPFFCPFFSSPPEILGARVGMLDAVPKVLLWQNFLVRWVRQGDGRGSRPQCHRFLLFFLTWSSAVFKHKSFLDCFMPLVNSQSAEVVVLSILCFWGRGFANLLIQS